MQLASTQEQKLHHKENVNVLLTKAESIKSISDWKPEYAENLIDIGPREPGESFQSALQKLPVVSKGYHDPMSKQTSRLPAPTLEDPTKWLLTMARRFERPVVCRELPTSEKVLLWKSSRLNGGPYPPWNAEQSSPHDIHAGPAKLNEINHNFPETQKNILKGWKRQTEHGKPTMKPTKPSDFVQDALTDCSVVASLSALATRIERGFSNLLSQIFFPFDEVTGWPAISTSGKYVIRMNFNGGLRKIWIDDSLPVSINDRFLHVIDRNNPNLLWPPLLEKAYLQIRGGYDFRGSNSGTDLWILTGWIPEYIHLSNEAIDSDQVWTQMFSGFQYGHVLITAGTGEILHENEQLLGLIGRHDYAVRDLKQDKDGRRYMLLKNPWMDGPIWRGKMVETSEQRTEDTKRLEPSSTTDSGELVCLSSASRAETSSSELRVSESGSFWMSFEDVLQYFNSIYLNWSPNLFKYQADLHFTWSLPSQRNCFGSIRSSPQLSISSTEDGTAWLVLSKHFTDASNDKRGQEAKKCFLSMLAFKNKGYSVVSGRNAVQKIDFVDAPQTVMQLKLEASETITIVPMEQELPSGSLTLTLSVYSTVRVELGKAKDYYSDTFTVAGNKNEDIPGGETNTHVFRQNPQYTLHLPATTQVCLAVETITNTDNQVRVQLVHNKGDRCEREPNKCDVLLDSGSYTKHCAVASTSRAYSRNQLSSIESQDEDIIPKGKYTVVIRAFNPDEIGRFKLSVLSNVNATLNPVMRPDAGRILCRFADVSFAPGVRCVRAPIHIQRPVTMYFAVKRIPALAPDPHADESAGSPVRISVEVLDERPRTIASSQGGRYIDAHPDRGGVRTEDLHLGPATGKAKTTGRVYLLLLERMSSGQERGEERFSVESWADTLEWGYLGFWHE